MNPKAEQIGPDREQLRQPTTVFDVLKDEVRRAQIYSHDFAAESRQFRSNFDEIMFMYVVPTKEGDLQLRHKLLQAINRDLSYMTYVGAKRSSMINDVSEGVVIRGAIMGVHAATVLLPSGTGIRTRILQEMPEIDVSDLGPEEEENEVEIYEQLVLAEIYYLDQQNESLPKDDRSTLDIAAMLVCPADVESRRFFNRGFLFAKNSVDKVIGELL